MSTFWPNSPEFLHANKSKHEYMFSINLFRANVLYMLFHSLLFSFKNKIHFGDYSTSVCGNICPPAPLFLGGGAVRLAGS